MYSPLALSLVMAIAVCWAGRREAEERGGGERGGEGGGERGGERGGEGEAQREVEREKRSRDARKEECMGRRLVVRRGGV